MIRRPPRSTRTDTPRSLHVALPICGVELIARHRIAAARGDGAVGNTGDARGDACTGCFVGGAVEQQGVVEYAVDCRIEIVELIADGCERSGHGCLAATAADCECRSEERRVGKECVSTCSSRGCPDNKKK